MDLKTYLPFTQAGVKNRFLFPLVVILLMLLLVPLLDGFVRLRILLDIFMSVIFIFSIYAASQEKRWTFTIAISLALPLLLSLWWSHFSPMPFVTIGGNFFGILFFTFMVTRILSFISGAREITREVIHAAIVVYLFLAVMWSFLYSVLERLQPGSFAIPEGLVNDNQFISIYLSFVTITTLGYGDITPLTPVARSLAILEAVIGQMYLVVIVAWLVGMHVAHSAEKRLK